MCGVETAWNLWITRTSRILSGWLRYRWTMFYAHDWSLNRYHSLNSTATPKEQSHFIALAVTDLPLLPQPISTVDNGVGDRQGRAVNLHLSKLFGRKVKYFDSFPFSISDEATLSSWSQTNAMPKRIWPHFMPTIRGTRTYADLGGGNDDNDEHAKRATPSPAQGKKVLWEIVPRNSALPSHLTCLAFITQISQLKNNSQLYLNTHLALISTTLQMWSFCFNMPPW